MKFTQFKQVTLPSKSCLFQASLFFLFLAIPVHSDNSLFFLAAFACGLAALGEQSLSLLPQDRTARYAMGGFLTFICAALFSSLLHPESLRSLPRMALWVASTGAGYCASRIKPAHLWNCLYGLGASLAGSALIGIFYWLNKNPAIFHDERLKLFAIHPSRLAVYAAAVFFFSLQAFFLKRGAKARLLHATLALLTLTLILLTNTRAMILLLPAGVILLLWVLPQKTKKQLILVMTLGTLLAGTLLWSNKTSFTGQRLISAVTNLPNDPTWRSRLPIWEAGWDAFLQSPVLGNGLFSYKRMHGTYREKHEKEWQERHPGFETSVKAAHNIILGRLVDTGLLGTAGFLLFYLLCTASSLRGDAKNRWVGVFLLYYLAIGQLDDPLFRSNDSFTLLLAAAALRPPSVTPQQNTQEKSLPLSKPGATPQIK